MKKYFIISILLLSTTFSYGQKVGLVLSGGGAAGSAHVGVLKALEKNNIPIDYITGTSIGALVGGFYAAGFSPEQIEQMITSTEFRNAAMGIIDEQHIYYFNKSDINAGFVSLNFNLDSVLEANIPTNFVSSNAIDFGLMIQLAAANAAANSNFDSLMIPFRCLAANVSKRQQEILKKGDLASSIRASMTYPFYLSPITIEGNLMFDGGLYNNFPSDILCKEFNPDYIIASNVATKIEAPTADNLLSQIKNLLIEKSEFKINCAKGIIIEADVDDIATFNFYENEMAIEKGFNATIKLMDSIKMLIPMRRNASELADIRAKFNRKKPPLIFEDIELEGLHPNQKKYIKQGLTIDSTTFTGDQLEKTYTQLISNEKIKSIYPEAKYQAETGRFKINLKTTKEKSFTATFGGVISTKPFSTGFFQLDYQRLEATGLKASGNIYFGNFYSSAQGKIKWDVPFDIPFSFESKFTVNKFDFFNGISSFVEDDDLPFIITSERYWESSLSLPVLRKGKISFAASYHWQENEYYQHDNFQRGDTADQTNFEGISTKAAYELNSLNRKMYANKGTKFNFSLRYVDGLERTNPGSTAGKKGNYRNELDWITLNLSFEKYLFNSGNFHLGTFLQGSYSDLPFFQNYTATLLNSPSFAPLPENLTLFQEQYRSKSFLGGGLKAIYSIRDHLDFRLEAYVYQPYEEFIENADGTTRLGEEIINRDYIGTFTAVYQTRVGPLALSLNYFDDAKTELSFLVHFGYILFNKKGLE